MLSSAAYSLLGMFCLLQVDIKNLFFSGNLFDTSVASVEKYVEKFLKMSEK